MSSSQWPVVGRGLFWRVWFLSCPQAKPNKKPCSRMPSNTWSLFSMAPNSRGWGRGHTGMMGGDKNTSRWGAPCLSAFYLSQWPSRYQARTKMASTEMSKEINRLSGLFPRPSHLAHWGNVREMDDYLFKRLGLEADATFQKKGNITTIWGKAWRDHGAWREGCG